MKFSKNILGKCEIINLSLIQLSEMHGEGRVKVNYIKMTPNLTIRQNFTNLFTNKVYLR